MKIISINKENIDVEHICCAIGNDAENKKRAETKKNWLKQMFEEGLVFKRLDERGKVFIEYLPIEKAWKPIVGENYLFINCLWVSGQFKGKGLSKELLNECINDAKNQNKSGIAVVSSTKVKPFLTDKKFYLKHGFAVADFAEPYFELLVLKFDKNSPNPKFLDRCKNLKNNSKGVYFSYSNQCPFMEEYVLLLANVCRSRNIEFTVQKITNKQEADEFGSPFGTLGIYYNGEFQTHELMPEKKFEKFLDELVK